MPALRLLRTAAATLAFASTLLTAGGANATGTMNGWEISLSGQSPAESLMSVSTVNADLAWAAGRTAGHGVIMRWDGETWSEDTAPGLPDVWEWSSVSAVSADDVWAYGTVERDQALVHYDGRRWTSVPTTGPTDDSWPEVPVAAVPGRLFKGGKALYTYSDGEWATFALPAMTHIRDIEALSADDAYATGMQYPVDGGHPVTYHWDGTTWTLLDEAPVPAGTDTAEIAVESPDSVYVAGWAQPDVDPPVPSVVHWNGSSWKDVTGALADLYLDAIVPDGRGGLWATGTDKAAPAFSDPVFWHFDGTTWTREDGTTASDGETRWPSYSFYDLAPVDDGSGAFWAVGDYQAPMDEHGDQAVHGLIERSTIPAIG